MELENQRIYNSLTEELHYQVTGRNCCRNVNSLWNATCDRRQWIHEDKGTRSDTFGDIR